MSPSSTPPASGNNTPPPASVPTGSWATYDPPTSDRRPAPYTTYTQNTYQPTAGQLTRYEQRRQYLRRNVYAPVIIAALVVIALFVVVVILAFGVRSPQAVSFITALSALVVVMIALPLTILMAIMPITWLALTVNRRQKRKLNPETGPAAYSGRIQSWLWQLDSLLDGLRHNVDGASSRVRRPLVRLHARAAYLKGLLDGLRGNFTRSI